MGRRDLGSNSPSTPKRLAPMRACFAAIRATGRSSRTRLADLLIAATTAANGLPLYTRNPSDFLGLDTVLISL